MLSVKAFTIRGDEVIGGRTQKYYSNKYMRAKYLSSSVQHEIKYIFQLHLNLLSSNLIFRPSNFPSFSQNLSYHIYYCTHLYLILYPSLFQYLSLFQYYTHHYFNIVPIFISILYPSLFQHCTHHYFNIVPVII